MVWVRVVVQQLRLLFSMIYIRWNGIFLAYFYLSFQEVPNHLGVAETKCFRASNVLELQISHEKL